MESPFELSFDCKPYFKFDEVQKLEELVARLEEECFKIDAFKRELPLCMHLLTNAMEASRQQLQTQRTTPVLEEFIPLKNDSSKHDESLSSDRSNWMTSAQLWSNQENDEILHPPLMASSQENEIKFRIKRGGAFHPFGSKDKTDVFPELALASSHEDDIHERKTSPENKNSSKSNGGEVVGATASTTQRKARRCWSPDLHRRFVNALHVLGGSQVATPKQIRELMKVDGLTNDEVKSHLQKYRLHTRRPSPAPQSAAGQPPQVVVLGGIWVPPEYAAAGHAASALYGAHGVQPHHVTKAFCSPVRPEIFPALAQPSPVVHHHYQQRIYSKMVMDSAPNSDVHGSGDGERSESTEDGKSESGVENCGERRKMENGEGEESNLSIVTLKF